MCSADCSRSGSLNGMVESVSSACATVGQSIIRNQSEVCISMGSARIEGATATGGRPLLLEITCSHNHIHIPV